MASFGRGEIMKPEEMLQTFKSEGYDGIITERMTGVKNKIARKTLWLTVDKTKLKDAVLFLIETAEEQPHFCIISTSDLGDEVELNYHFTVGWGKKLEELQFTFKVILSKKDLTIDSLTDVVPAIIFSEREIREMMGVEVQNLPDKRHLFLTPNFPEGVYPWRRDETGPKKTNKLYEGWKQ